MDKNGKTKDNIKARMDIVFFFYHHKNIELVYVGSQVAKPKTSLALDKNA
jgi:hypothetical protein